MRVSTGDFNEVKSSFFFILYIDNKNKQTNKKNKKKKKKSGFAWAILNFKGPP